MLSLFLFLGFKLQAQEEKAVGNFPIQNYPPDQYGEMAQNFDILEGDRGIMYFGNGSGVMIYDGEEWRLKPVKSENTVTALGKGENGVIYVGSKGEFGYLTPDTLGNLKYVPLSDSIDQEEEIEFGNIIQVHALNGHVFFQANQVIFDYDVATGQIKVISADNAFHDSFILHDRLFVRELGEGLKYLSDEGNFELIGAETKFKKEQIQSLIPLSEDTTLVITHKYGLFHLIGNEKEGWKEVTPLKKFQDLPDDLIASGLDEGIRVSAGVIAIGSWGNGVILIKNDGELIRVINKNNGLYGGIVNSLYLDERKGLWVALNNGISKVEINSPVTYFDQRNALNGTVEDITYFHDGIYAATHAGLYHLSYKSLQHGKRKTSNPEFRKIEGFRSECWGMMPFSGEGGEELLVAGNDGVYRVNEEGATDLITNCYPWGFVRSPVKKNRVYVGLDNGVIALERTPNGWERRFKVKGVEGSVLAYSQGKKPGELFLGTRENGFYRLDDHKDSTQIQISHVPTGEETGIASDAVSLGYWKEPLIGTSDGLLVFDEENGKCVPHPYDSLVFDQKRLIHRISPEKDQRLWLVTYLMDKEDFDIGYVDPTGERPIWRNRPLKRFNTGVVQSIFHSSSHITWLGAVEGLFRFDPSFEQTEEKAFPTLIRKVSLAEDSLVFGGNFRNNGGDLQKEQAKRNVPVFPYAENSISFQFSSPYYVAEEKNQYSYKLVGFHQDWSHWKKDNKAVYTNLTEGTYKFKVKARNVYGEVSEEAIYEFTVLPPWYRTMWAFLGYFFGAVLLVYVAIKLSLYRLQKQKEKLEEIVEERTKEIATKNEKLEHQKEEIEKKNENLEEANQEITNQKELIEEKNKDILASIKYAQRIQEAILPPKNKYRRMGSDAFVLFKPKDIVSGDFYWSEEMAGKKMFSAIDCTGHGVPGAFVSIVAYNALSQALNEFQITQPAAILDKLNDLVEQTFQHQEHKDVKDGMDMGLCVIDPETNLLEFAGANNPLYLIRKEGNPLLDEEGKEVEAQPLSSDGWVLYEIKGDKQPIGVQEDKQPFTEWRLKVESGDVLYVFSDGYADQFGGPKGKKFKYKPFKRLLLSIQDRSMEEQQKYLDETIHKWMGELEQVDDICVFGLQV